VCTRLTLIVIVAIVLAGSAIAPCWADSTTFTKHVENREKGKVAVYLEALRRRVGLTGPHEASVPAQDKNAEIQRATTIGGQDPEEYKLQLAQWQRRLDALCGSDNLIPTQTDLYNQYCIPADPLDPADPTSAAAVPRLSPALLGGLAVAELTMPTPVPQIGPPPEINEWNMAAVGYPLWLWTEDTTAMSSSASVMGETVMLTARRTGVSFHMGDGNSVTCPRTTRWTSAVAPEHESPTCGYRYTKASLPEGNYQVVAVAEWEVTWSVLGETGMIPIQKAASTELPVGQLRSVITGR